MNFWAFGLSQWDLILSGACAIEANIAVVGAFAVESAFDAHIEDAEFTLATSGIFAAFDIIFAFVFGVTNFSFAAFGISAAFDIGFTFVIVVANLTLSAIALCGT